MPDRDMNTGSRASDFAPLPKVELHCHLEACFYQQSMLELGRELGLGATGSVEEFRREWLLTQPLQDLESALKKFSRIQSVWCSEAIIERLTYEACCYGHEQGIRIFELRYSPDFIAHGHSQLSFEKIHCAILAGLERARELPIAVGLIGIIQKSLPAKKIAYTGDFFAEHRQTFVGIDFADHDAENDITRFAAVSETARIAGLRVTCHAGEEPTPGAPAEVREAVERLGAERIGHGIHIINDPGVMEYITANDVLLEVCPTSNWLTGSAASIAAHPLRQLLDAGVPVCVNSDDPGLFEIDLNHEYSVLAAEQDFSMADFDYCNDLAAAHSFIDIEDRQRVWPRPLAVI